MDRRKFIAGAGGVLLTSQAPKVLAETEIALPNNSCAPTTRLTQGPYLVPGSARRSDIREDRMGVPLKLDFTVVNDFWCQPASEFVVEIWHCDAEGFYSGVDNIVFDPATLLPTDRALDMKDHTFLRGHQVSDENGKVEFTTIYPGWYMPRLAHIHVRLMWRDVEWTALDTQLFLPADVERAVYQTDPYAARGPNPIEIERDIVLKGNKDVLKDLTAQLEKDGDGFRGQFEFGVVTL
jgi:protocatechuate 3,4-dioxygenase beta subunit